MSDYITLLGAEQVQTARQQRQFMDDWLQRFEQAIEKLNLTGGDRP